MRLESLVTEPTPSTRLCLRHLSCPEPDNLPRLVLPAGLDIEVRARVTLGQIAGDCATRDLGGGFRGAARRNPRMSPAQARCCLTARGAIKMISPVPDHHAGPRRLSRPERHEKHCSAKASAAANPGCRGPRSLRT